MNELGSSAIQGGPLVRLIALLPDSFKIQTLNLKEVGSIYKTWREVDCEAGARLALLLLVILYRKERWIMNNLDQAVERISSFL